MKEIARRITKAARPVGDPGTPDPTMCSRELEKRQATVEKLRALVGMAQEGDGNAADALREVLDDSPDLAWSFIAGPGKIAESAMIDCITTKDNLANKELLKHQLASMKVEVAGEDPSPLERLLAEQVVATWLQMRLFEAIYAFEMSSAPMRRGDYLQKCLDRAHRRHLSAIKTLAQIRKMGPAVQINIAEKQVNTAG